MTTHTALRSPALVHIRLLRNFIEATEYERARAAEDNVRDSLEELLDSLRQDLNAYRVLEQDAVIHEAA